MWNVWNRLIVFQLKLWVTFSSWNFYLNNFLFLIPTINSELWTTWHSIKIFLQTLRRLWFPQIWNSWASFARSNRSSCSIRSTISATSFRLCAEINDFSCHQRKRKLNSIMRFIDSINLIVDFRRKERDVDGLDFFRNILTQSLALPEFAPTQAPRMPRKAPAALKTRIW